MVFKLGDLAWEEGVLVSVGRVQGSLGNFPFRSKGALQVGMICSLYPARPSPSPKGEGCSADNGHKRCRIYKPLGHLAEPPR